MKMNEKMILWALGIALLVTMIASAVMGYEREALMGDLIVECPGGDLSMEMWDTDGDLTNSWEKAILKDAGGKEWFILTYTTGEKGELIGGSVREDDGDMVYYGATAFLAKFAVVTDLCNHVQSTP